MSDFSEACRRYIDETGTNIYQLSKISGLDRTSLQRMVTGKRLPKPDFVRQFCLHLRINPQQKDALMELYDMERIGKSAYFNRKYIQLILEHLSSPSPSPRSYDPVIDPKRQTVLSVEAEEALEYFLDAALSQFTGTPRLFTNIPAECTFFFRLLLRLTSRLHRQFQLCHLFYLSRNPEKIENANINLELLQCALSFMLTGYSYQPQYYYAKDAVINASALLYPYYFISETSAFLLSGDFSSFIALKDPDIIRRYQEEAENQFRSSTPLFFTKRSPEEVISFYCGLSGKQPLMSKVLEAQPCALAMIYDPELLKDAGSPALTSSLQTLCKSFNTRPASSGAFHNYFTLSGLKHFIETGHFSGPYACLPVSYPPETRKEMLAHFLRRHFQTGEYTMLRDQPLLADKTYYEVFSDHSVFLCLPDSESTFLGLYVAESSIGQAFFDYFSSLEDSPLVYSAPEAEEIITQYIKELDK